MSTKVIVYGSMSQTPPGFNCTYFRKNGTTYYYYKNAGPTINRRFGHASSITSRSGVDGRFRPCSHSKAYYLANPLTLLPPYQYAKYNAVSPTDFDRAYAYNLGGYVHALRYSRFTQGVDAVTLSLASVQWDSLAQTALQAMLPTFHGKNSLVNFILELKDFKSIVKYMRGGLETKLTTMQALFGFRRADKPLKKLSKAYLSYSFGWRPLFNDLVTFVQTVSGFLDRYRELVQREGKPQQSYYGTWLSGTAAGESTYYNNSTGDGPASWEGPFLCKYRVKVVQEATQGIRYHATVRYRYQIPSELLSVSGKVKAFLDLLGVSQNPAILWNAIPFSFIVDWVVNVSDYLERLRVDNIDFKTEILDFCHSARIERKIRYDIAGENYHYASGYSSLAWWTADSCVKTVYERKIGIPNFLTAIQTSGLNPREFSLAGALWVANSRRR